MKKNIEKAVEDTDSPWKEGIEFFFEAFVQFFLPQAHAAINWRRPVEFLDKEMQKILRDAELGRSYADKLVKVYLKNGIAVWILIHIEVQARKDNRFELRMYVYNYRFFDRYRQPVISFSVLADDDPDWRPSRFSHGMFGSEAGLKFTGVKLLDYRERWAELEASRNPFAVLVMAHLKALETRKDMDARYNYRRQLTRNMLTNGKLARKTVRELLRLVDWLLPMPDTLEHRLDDDIEQLEKEDRMPFVGTLERIALRRGREEGRQEGRVEGRQEGIQEGLEKGAVNLIRETVLDILNDRFSKVPRSAAKAVQSIGDLKRLKTLRKAATTAPTLKDFLNAL